MREMDLKTMKNLPNYLTLCRIAMIPVLVLIYPIDSFTAKVARSSEQMIECKTLAPMRVD